MKNYTLFSIENTQTPEYHIALKPDCYPDFEKQLDSLISKYDVVLKDLGLTNDNLIYAKIFMSDYVNHHEYLAKNKQFQEISKCCALSIIEQSPLDGTKINMLLYFIKKGHILKESKEGVFIAKIDGLSHIYQSIISFEASVHTAKEQTTDAFYRHIKLLLDRGLTLKDNCIRTWLYSRDVDRDYASIVEARNNVFEKEGLTTATHYIASTGIEGKGLELYSAVNIDFYSIDGIEQHQIKYLNALEYLNNTAEYGVAFERGTSVTYGDKKHIFISGTASIDKYGNCVHRNNVLLQTQRLFTNIEMLLLDAESNLKDIAQMIVYLRNITDYECVNNYLKEYYSGIPKVIVLGRVCRPEWLIEIECIAVKRTC